MSESWMQEYLGWGRSVWRYNFYVKYDKASTKIRDDAVCNHFDDIKGASFGSDVYGLDDAITPDSDPNYVLVLLVGLEHTHKHGVGDFFVMFSGDISAMYYVEVSGAFGML